MNHFKNCISSFIQAINGRIRGKISFNTLLGLTLGVAVALCAITINIENSKIYVIKVNNKNIGYVKNIETYNKAMDAIKKTDGQEPLQSITVEKTSEKSKSFVDSSTIEKIARHELNLKMPAVAMYVNDTQLAIVDSKATADNVIEQVKKYYYPKQGSFTILSSNIKETVTTTDMMVNPENIVDVNDAVQKIVTGRGVKKTYTVKQGDTIWDIALKNDLTIEELQAVNPGLNVDKVKPGQEINFALNLPYVNVEIVADIKSKEVIPYDSKSTVDNSMNKGTKKVKQAGVNGLAQVEKKVTILNGEVMQEDVLTSTVVQAPVNELLVVGGKVTYYVATGTFIRPSRGVISSRYGRRGREMHTGVDFASPTGTPIVAADSGTVSFVGWHGGYGLCVMIKHSNGYQTLYGHTSKVFVKVGQSVKKGQQIANVGSTGRSTGPHVHFEIRKNGVLQNPLNYVR